METENKRRLIDTENILKAKGNDFCSVLPTIHCVTGCDTVSAFFRRGKKVQSNFLIHKQTWRIFAKLVKRQE
ncbi:hypothetical protein DPMN_100071 [Dreissena polymorpha]|uniref:Uncharacterized protein n=1 Tax=Dreissena polymorpha TaxID=45954 RepID=A0A9D4LGN2_DREPO|nr:hypothetical protein DPMN_100071 [Dreissena polymorpha]